MVTDSCKLYTGCLYAETWTCHDLVTRHFTSFEGSKKTTKNKQ